MKRSASAAVISGASISTDVDGAPIDIEGADEKVAPIVRDELGDAGSRIRFRSVAAGFMKVHASIDEQRQRNHQS
jgi:hypothetical protein